MNIGFATKMVFGMFGAGIGMKLAQIGLELYFKGMPKISDIAMLCSFLLLTIVIIKKHKEQGFINNTSDVLPFMLYGGVLGIVFSVWINLHYGLIS